MTSGKREQPFFAFVNDKTTGKRKGDDQMLAACAESGSLKVKIMRLGTAAPSFPRIPTYQQPTSFQQQQGFQAQAPTNSFQQQQLLHGVQHHASQFNQSNPHQQHVATLGPPPGATPSLGVQNSLLGGGIQNLPSMVVDTRNFKWLPGSEPRRRPRVNSLPNYTINPSFYQSNTSTGNHEV